MSAVGVSESGVRPILAEAVQLARRALLDLEPVGVGAHLGVTSEDESSATHHFEATLPGYHGWQWAVVVAAPPEATRATVSESALLPGPDALVAPDFIPWEERVRPGDLAPGDLLAPRADDPRLVPGYIATGDPVVDEVALEIGLGRTQVLSREGREEAAERWFSEYGPDTDMARAAPSTCGLCGFYVPLAGSLRAAFGVCGNAMGADGHVVHFAYGCGAHSDVEIPTGGGSPAYEAYDDAAVDLIPDSEFRTPPADESSAAAEADSPLSGVEDTAPAAVATEMTSAAVEAAPAADTEASEPASDDSPTSAVDQPIAGTESVAAAAESGDADAIQADDAVLPQAEPEAEATLAESGTAETAAPRQATDNHVVTLFDFDPDAGYDDAWAVTAVRVEPDTGRPGESGAAEAN